MKNILLLTASLYISMAVLAQNNQPAKPVTTIAPVSKQVVVQQVQLVKPAQLIRLPAGQPDLKFTDFNVKALDSFVVDGIKKYNVNVSYSITNTGTAPIVTDNVTIITYLCNEYWIARTQDVHLTGIFSAAGGGVLTTGGKSLAPGATTTTSYTIPLKFPTAPKPVMLITMSVPDNLNEKDKTNNSTYKTILL